MSARNISDLFKAMPAGPASAHVLEHEAPPQGRCGRKRDTTAQGEHAAPGLGREDPPQGRRGRKHDITALQAMLELLYVCIAKKVPTVVDDTKLRHLHLSELEHLASTKNAERTASHLNVNFEKYADVYEKANDKTN